MHKLEIRYSQDLYHFYAQGQYGRAEVFDRGGALDWCERCQGVTAEEAKKRLMTMFELWLERQNKLPKTESMTYP